MRCSRRSWLGLPAMSSSRFAAATWWTTCAESQRVSPCSIPPTQQVLDRLRHGPVEDKALAPLTDQEKRILELIGQGMTNRQIAEAVFLAEKTVKNYVSSLLAKLGMERRTQAAVFASKHFGTS